MQLYEFLSQLKQYTFVFSEQAQDDWNGYSNQKDKRGIEYIKKLLRALDRKLDKFHLESVGNDKKGEIGVIDYLGKMMCAEVIIDLTYREKEKEVIVSKISYKTKILTKE